MTRTHCAIQLLRHGPLTMREFIQITGWTVRQSRKTIGYLACDVKAIKAVKRGTEVLYVYPKALPTEPVEKFHFTKQGQL